MAKAAKEKTTINGTVSAIKFRNSDNWAVFEVKQDDMFGSTMKCVGILAQIIDAGTEVTCTGVIEVNQYGRQLKCETVVPAAPEVESASGVIKLLQRLPGIGPKKAELAVREHGHEQAWEYALTDPEKLGVPARDAEMAADLAQSLISSYEAIVYLLGIGLTDNQAMKIYECYKADTVKVVSEDPYRLIQIDGFGFLTVDKIALKAGIPVGSASRISACILYVINDSATCNGHVWHQGWELAEVVLDALSQAALQAEVPLVGAPTIEDVRRQIYFLESEGKVEVDEGRVFSKSLLRAEQSILDLVTGGA